MNQVVIYSGVAVELIDLPNPFTYTDADGVSQTITYSNNGPNKVQCCTSCIMFLQVIQYLLHLKKSLLNLLQKSDTSCNCRIRK